MIKSFLVVFFNKIINFVKSLILLQEFEDKNLILSAKVYMSSSLWMAVPNFQDPKWLQTKEFRVYSEYGDDGIIQWLINYLQISSRNFIEFGVGNFHESNSHFLLVNNNWNGFVLDSSEKNIAIIKKSQMYWRYNLIAKKAFIDKDNINSLLSLSKFEKLGYLHIDLDGNDYWILENLDLGLYSPDILILEYNAIFGDEEKISIPYNPKFARMNSHFTGKYWGASLQGLNFLAEKKGYYFIGCNSAGNNAYFLNNTYLSKIPKTNVVSGFQKSQFRESRDIKGNLSFLNNNDVRKELNKLPVIDVETKEKKFL